MEGTRPALSVKEIHLAHYARVELEYHNGNGAGNETKEVTVMLKNRDPKEIIDKPNEESPHLALRVRFFEIKSFTIFDKERVVLSNNKVYVGEDKNEISYVVKKGIPEKVTPHKLGLRPHGVAV